MHSYLDLLLRLNVAKDRFRLFLLSRWTTHKRSGILLELTLFTLFTPKYVLTRWLMPASLSALVYARRLRHSFPRQRSLFFVDTLISSGCMKRFP